MSVLAFSLSIGLLVGMLRTAGGIAAGTLVFGAVIVAAAVFSGASQAALTAAMAISVFNLGLFATIFVPLLTRDDAPTKA